MKLTVHNIVKNFGSTGLDPVSFTLKEGEQLCITGRSGCGKSTLLNIISGMLCPDSGNIYIDEKEIYKDLNEKQRTRLRNEKVGYMMQCNTLIPSLTVRQNIVCPLEMQGRKESPVRLEALLDSLKIKHIENAYPWQISGGEYRRVLLTRVLLLNPAILIADEPTSSLDKNSARLVKSILDDYCKNKNNSLIIATHDEALFSYCTKALRLGK